MCLYMQQRSMSVGVIVTLWMMVRTPANIVSFVVIVGANMFRPLEEIASSSLGDLSKLY